MNNKNENKCGLEICVLGSGSSGNCIYLKAGGSEILIDFGFSESETRKRLEKINVRLEDIQAVLVTHEHIDHCYGLGKITRSISGPVYLNDSTYQAISSQLEGEKIIKFANGDFFTIGDFLIKPFSVLHDAAAPCGFSLFYKNKKIAIATDLGLVNNIILQNMADSNVIVIESNYDKKTLMNGKYPWFLKNRILGQQGHLSNHDAAMAVKKIAHPGLECIFLFHLSEKNNTPELAVDTMKSHMPGENTAKIFSSSQEDLTPLFSY